MNYKDSLGRINYIDGMLGASDKISDNKTRLQLGYAITELNGIILPEGNTELREKRDKIAEYLADAAEKGDIMMINDARERLGSLNRTIIEYRLKHPDGLYGDYGSENTIYL
jgi:hypothetical protein